MKGIDKKDFRLLQNEINKIQGSTGLTMDQFTKAKPEELGNNPNIELNWAQKAFEYSEHHFQLLKNEDPQKIRFTKIDEQLYLHFRKIFSDLDVEYLPEMAIKKTKAKNRWRLFCDCYKNDPEIPDFNFGTLLRLISHQGYDESNTILVPRIQFIVIELARNKEGCNILLQTKEKETDITICSYCRRPNPPMKCAKCLKVSYCNRKCQIGHWSCQHKNVCK